MPRRKRRTRRVKRKRKSRRKGISKITTLTLRGLTLFADRYHCKLQSTFASTTVTPAVLTFSEFLFTPTALRDPFGAHSSNNPLGFTEIMNIYGSYRVNAIQLNIQIANKSTDVPMMIVIIPSISTASRDIGSIVGERYLSRRMVGTVTGPSLINMSNYFKPKVIVADPTYDNSADFNGTSGANPLALVYQKVRIEPVGGVNAGTFIEYSFRFTLTFWTSFFDRVQINN